MYVRMYSLYVSMYICTVYTYVCTVCTYVCTYVLYVCTYVVVCRDWHSHALQGEIRATAFNEAADKFYHVLEVDKVYYITKCQLKPANKQFTSLKNDYEMYIREETEVEEVRMWEGDGVVGE